MTKKKSTPAPEIARLLAMYGQRPAKYSGTALQRRRADFRTAQGINQLHGMPEPTAAELAAVELWLTGRITDGEYFRLCAPYKDWN